MAFFVESQWNTIQTRGYGYLFMLWEIYEFIDIISEMMLGVKQQ